MATIESGQFDDAPATTVIAPTDPRSVQPFIDDYNSEDLSWPDSAGEDDSDSIDDTYDDNRVEDEDWEIAEGGMFDLRTSVSWLFLTMGCRLYEAIQSPATTRRGPHRQRAGHCIIDQSFRRSCNPPRC